MITIGSNVFRNHFGDWMDRVAAGQDVLVTRRGKPRIRLTAAT
jgi:prevent-host-death family protein